MASLFISYSRRDIDVARKLTEAFKGQELDFWIDWEGIPPTVDWWEEIQKGIEEANIFIFLISPDSAKSKVCKREIEHAARNGKRLIPLIVRDIKAEESPAELSHLNWLFFRESDDFPSALQKLITAIQTDYEWTQVHRRLQVRALEWERGNKDNSFLLRGKDLDDAQAELVTNASKNPGPTELQTDFVLRSRQASDRQKRIVTGSAVIGLVIMAVLAVYGFVQANLARSAESQAEERAVLARAGELAAQSISQRSRDFTNSLLLGVEAYRTRETVQTRGTLLDNVYANPVLRLYLRRYTTQVTSLAFSPDGKLLASTAPNEARVLLWDVKDGKFPVQTLTMYSNSVAFSPDGNSLAAGGLNQIALWDIQSGKPAEKFIHNSEIPTENIQFSPDGKSLITGNKDLAVNIWDVPTGKLISQPLNGQAENISDNVNSMTFSPDGKILALASSDNISLWNVETGQHMQVPFGIGWDGVTGTGGSLAFHPNGKILAIGGSSKVILWNVETQLTLGGSIEVPTTDIRSYDSQVATVAFSPDGNILISGSEDGTIVLWDVSAADTSTDSFTSSAIYTLTGQVSGVFSPVTSIAFSADGNILASGYQDGTIILWDMKRMINGSEDVPEEIGRSLFQYDNIVNSVAFSADGRKLASGFGDGTVYIWDLLKGQSLNEPAVKQTGGVLNLAFSPDPAGKMIASGGREVFLLNGETAQLIGQPLDGQQDRVTSLSFDPDGKLLASSGSGTVILWDLRTGRPMDPLPNTSEIQSVAFSPDGKTLAAGSADGYILLWDIETRELILQLDTNGDAIFSIAFSPDGKLVASGNADGTLSLWDIEAKKQIGQPLNRHTGIVNQVAFSPDGKMLASGSMDQTIILWDVDTQQAVGQPLHGDSGGVNSVAFSPDGMTLASGSGNFDQSRVILWDIDVMSWLQKTCQRAGRNFTISEWNQFFPDEPYRKTCEEFQRDPDYYRALAKDLLSDTEKPLDLHQAIENLRMEMGTDSALNQPATMAKQFIQVIVEGEIFHETYNGNVLRALDLMEQAQENDLVLDSWLMDSNFFNTLCWNGSLSGAAARVIVYCEKAVALAPDDPYARDSRGLARALTNDYSGAMEDFQFFIENDDDENLIEQRRTWINELKAGKNPFTPEALKQLQD